MRDHATVLARSGRSEDALAALEATTALNSFHPDCWARYHLLRTEIYRNLSRSAQAQEELNQTNALLQTQGLAYLQPLATELTARF